VLGNEVKKVAVDARDDRVHALAQPAPTPGDGVEYRLHVGRRPRDDTKDLARRGLLIERLGELAVPRLDLLEQPHVLDRDDGLVGEGRDEGDLAVVEGFDSRATHRDYADHAPLAHHGDGQERPVAHESLGLALLVVGIGEYVGDVDRAPLGGGMS
jgi:hypothetical protein